MKVLIIEDDERIALPIKEHLEHQRYLAFIADDGVKGLELARNQEFDLILIDLMLPRMDGLSVCRTLRQEGKDSAIMIISAKEQVAVRIASLDSGADDYMVKPFDIDELSARCRAVLRRNKEPRDPQLRCGHLELDPSTCLVSYHGNKIDLTPTEYRLLAHFMRNPHRIYNKEELLDKLWMCDEPKTSAIIKAHMKGLRKKLVASGAPNDLVTTVHGFGYQLKSNDN